jgi:hypothetical protein
MVFDASNSKLNEALFAPRFSLAIADAMARTVDVGSFGADNDYGEMFYLYHSGCTMIFALTVGSIRPTSSPKWQDCSQTACAGPSSLGGSWGYGRHPTSQFKGLVGLSARRGPVGLDGWNRKDGAWNSTIQIAFVSRSGSQA